jgi:hypothetical protein
MILDTLESDIKTEWYFAHTCTFIVSPSLNFCREASTLCQQTRVELVID